MFPFITLLLGIVAGAVCMFILLYRKTQEVRLQRRQQDAHVAEIQRTVQSLTERERELAAKTNAFISYDELRSENQLFRRDLRNIDVNLRKLELDRELQAKRQRDLDSRCNDLGNRYLKDTVKSISQSLTSNNYSACKQRLLDAITRCRELGLQIPTSEEEKLVGDLKEQFEMAVRAAIEREEQARIKAQIREEQKLQREIERELAQAERERAAVEAALGQARARSHDETSAEIELLKRRLMEAEARAQRAISRAQLTKSGHVYVISNIGSFGDGVFKIGMTRRLNPNERVRELGDASVPFPYDVHMVIASSNAPSLENALHRALHKRRLNKVNPRKEFFQADIETIREIVISQHGEVQYIADAEALEFRQSITMTDEDAEFIERTFSEVEVEVDVDDDEDSEVVEDFAS